MGCRPVAVVIIIVRLTNIDGRQFLLPSARFICLLSSDNKQFYVIIISDLKF